MNSQVTDRGKEMNAIAICLTLALIAAYLGWKLWEADQYMMDLEDELDIRRRQVKMMRWSGIDDPLMRM